MTDLAKISKLIRYFILKSTSVAGSGHPTSSLSAADLMNVLMFGGNFRFDFDNPDSPANDRLIFSKGHASPLYYSLFLAAGQITEKEILELRKFDSVLEGHPTPRFKFTEAATGSLGQGLSVGVGMALAIKNRNLEVRSKKSDDNNKNINNSPTSVPNVFVLLGDGEMAEGSVWEAANLASYYKLDNLTAIIDVNRLGQSGGTMAGWNTDFYRDKFISFGWDTAVIDGHDYDQISNTFDEIKHQQGRGKPFVIIAKTVKGKGISLLENKEGWHGKPVPKDLLDNALKELGDVDLKIRGVVLKPDMEDSNKKSEVSSKNLKTNNIPTSYFPASPAGGQLPTSYKLNDLIATRKAYGDALALIGVSDNDVVVLDAEVSNSTYAEVFKNKFPDRFFEMFIAEQNMVGTAVGFSRLGYKPFVSTFAAFLTRGFDQIRMAALGGSSIRFCGSHAGVSIGEDGPSQMGLEDIAMFGAVFGSTILYPSDAVSASKLVYEMANLEGISYIRTTRGATPVIYRDDENFPIGGSKIHRSSLLSSASSKVLIISAGITLFESLKAQKELEKENISVDVIDCYSIKPIDAETIRKEARGAKVVVTVEDHWVHGGLGDMVLHVLAGEKECPVLNMAVSKIPRSGKPEELLSYEEIDSLAIISKIKKFFK